MAASGIRTVKAIAQHVPSIKFPNRAHDAIFQDVAAVSTAVLSPPVLSPPVLSPPSPSPVSISQPQTVSHLAETYQKPFGSTPRGSGVEPSAMPARYRRKPLDLFEIEFIEKGGAV